MQFLEGMEGLEGSWEWLGLRVVCPFYAFSEQGQPVGICRFEPQMAMRLLSIAGAQSARVILEKDFVYALGARIRCPFLTHVFLSMGGDKRWV